MRQWRVGSFSMGLLLILLGVGLILDRFKGSASSLQLIIDWWPVILILLGCEVLAAGFLSKNEQFRIRYDFWSILLVAIFFFFSLGSYALNFSGILPRLQEAISSREYSVALPKQEIALDGIDKVVLTYDGNLELRSSNDENIHIFGEALLFALDADDAGQLAMMGAADYHRAGNTLFVQAKQLPTRYDFFRTGARSVKRTILVPDTMALEVTGGGRYNDSMHLVIDSLAASWSISIFGQITAILDSGLDATVSCYTDWRDGLSGNVTWTVEPAGEDDGYPPGGNSATFILGEGRWPLFLSAAHSIELNTR